MSKIETILSFDEVSFGYGQFKPILDEAGFSVRRGAKMVLMGQNGAGKSTIFNLITGVLRPDSGSVNLVRGVSIATSMQVIPRDQMDLTVEGFLEKCFTGETYDLIPKIRAVLEAVNITTPIDRTVKSLSGGEQARILLASALIQEPDLLLLDEPTNNLDKAGIEHLTGFLVNYRKTCIVISHDTDFLNAFTEGVVYLDIFTRKTEQYVGNYVDVVREISARLEKENQKNARLEKIIQEKKDKSNYFAHKGGQMRLVAKRMREKAAELEEEKVDVRREDKIIRPFFIPVQRDLS